MTVRAEQRGFTLIEMAFVAILVSLITLGVIMFTQSTNDANNSVQEAANVNFSLRRALTLISDDLRQSNATKIVVTEGAEWDRIDFQVPVAYVGSTVTWGAMDTADWHVRILVEDGWLVRRVVDATGTPMRTDEVLAREVDGLFDGQKGFSVTAGEGLYQISLRVTGERGTREWRRTETTSVQVRN